MVRQVGGGGLATSAGSAPAPADAPVISSGAQREGSFAVHTSDGSTPPPEGLPLSAAPPASPPAVGKGEYDEFTAISVLEVPQSPEGSESVITPIASSPVTAPHSTTAASSSKAASASSRRRRWACINRPYFLEGFCSLYFFANAGYAIYAGGWGGLAAASSWSLLAYCLAMGLAFACFSLAGCFAR